LSSAVGSSDVFFFFFFLIGKAFYWDWDGEGKDWLSVFSVASPAN